MCVCMEFEVKPSVYVPTASVLFGCTLINEIYDLGLDVRISQCKSYDMVITMLDLIARGWQVMDHGIWIRDDEMMMVSHFDSPFTEQVHTAQWMYDGMSLTCLHIEHTREVYVSDPDPGPFTAYMASMLARKLPMHPDSLASLDTIQSTLEDARSRLNCMQY